MWLGKLTRFLLWKCQYRWLWCTYIRIIEIQCSQYIDNLKDICICSDKCSPFVVDNTVGQALSHDCQVSEFRWRLRESPFFSNVHLFLKDTVKRLLTNIPIPPEDDEHDEDSESDVLYANEEDWYEVCIRYVLEQICVYRYMYHTIIRYSCIFSHTLPTSSL